MSKVYERLLKCYQCFKEKIDFTPKIALILGSGLGDYAEQADIKAVFMRVSPGGRGRQSAAPHRSAARPAASGFCRLFGSRAWRRSWRRRGRRPL